MARPEGLEPPTIGLEIRCSIQLSYGRGYEPETGLQVYPSSLRRISGVLGFLFSTFSPASAAQCQAIEGALASSEKSRSGRSRSVKEDCQFELAAEDRTPQRAFGSNAHPPTPRFASKGF